MNRQLRSARYVEPPVTIVIMKGCDGRYTYCPRPAIPILKPQYQPGEFDTAELALAAIIRDETIPSGAVVELDEAPEINQRFRLRNDVDRYPDFIAPAGATGTVVEVCQDLIGLKMDQPIRGCEVWENVVYWNRITSPGSSPHVVFRKDCEST